MAEARLRLLGESTGELLGVGQTAFGNNASVSPRRDCCGLL